MSTRAVLAASAAALASAGVLIPVTGASAATINVTTTTDGGPGSLRDAFDQANANPGADTIVLAAGATYQLTICGDDDDNSGGDLDGTEGPITIQGNGATIQQTCVGRRVIDQNVTETLTLDNVTITGGTEDDDGGGFSADGDAVVTNAAIIGNTADDNGGGFVAYGEVTISDSVVQGNSAVDEGGGINANGLTMSNTTVSGNDADRGGGLVHGNDAIITTSTISGNSATTGGGGIASEDDVIISNSTITGNTALSYGGGHYSDDYDTELAYVTMTANSAPEGANIYYDGGLLDVFGTVIAAPMGGGASCEQLSTNSSGYNYEAGSDTCELDDVTDVVDGADPQLGALAANGGPTQTQLPATTSPLVDAIPAADPRCTGTDQRGITRPQFAGCDIGAVELAPAPPTTTTTTPIPTTAPPAALVTPAFTG